MAGDEPRGGEEPVVPTIATPIQVGGIRSSKSIKEITKAMIKFQTACEVIPKSADNPYFKSKYADLVAIWKKIKKPLSENGILVMHGIQSGDGEATVTTRLVHESCEWLETDIMLKTSPQWDKERRQMKENKGAQAIGSLVTYGKRYAMSALLNVVCEGEDDDGNSAEGRTDTKPSAAARQQPKSSGKATPAAAKVTGPNGKAATKKEWAWAKSAPVWDKNKQKYECPACSKECTTKTNPKTGTYVSYCDCKFAYDWEDQVPEPQRSRLKEGAKGGKGGKK